MNHFEKFNLFSKFQSGYRKNHSTQTALLKLMDDIRLGIENGKVTVLVMLDFSLAFNTLKHESILQFCKLANFSPDALHFLLNYLINRRFFISDKTRLLPLTSGIPQGTGPGPVLYIGGTNSIEKIILYAFMKFFVDDDDIYVQCFLSELPSAIRMVNTDLQNVVNWSKTVGININPKKTKAMIFGSRHNLGRLRDVDIPNVIINGTAVPYSETVKNLGVWLSVDLLWNDQITFIISQINKALHPLYKNARFLPSPVKTLLIKQLIFPLFDYACLVYNSLTDFLDSKLQKIQNKCIRFIFGIPKSFHITPYRRQLHWLTTSSRRKYFLAVQTYKVLSSNKPDYLYSAFSEFKQNKIRQFRVTTQKPFDLPLIRTNTYEHAFIIQAISYWNELPIEITTADTINIFKSKLFKYLFARDI